MIESGKIGKGGEKLVEAVLKLFWVILILLVLLTFRDYGMSWDEPTRHRYGERVVRLWSTHFQDTSALLDHRTNLYGGAFEAPAVVLSNLVPLSVVDTRHLLIALVGLLGILGAARIGRLLAGARGALCCALLLALIPSYYGHMFINSKDIPFAVGYIWSLYFLLLVLKEYPEIRTATALKLGVAIGLTLGIRVGGLLFYGYLALVAGVCLALDSGLRRDLPGTFRSRATVMGRLFLSIPVSYALMLLSWPWIWRRPLTGPFFALARFANYPQKGPVLFRGQLLPADEVPWDYLPVYLLGQLPEVLLIALLLGVVWAGWLSVKDQAASESKTVLSLALPGPVQLRLDRGSRACVKAGL